LERSARLSSVRDACVIHEDVETTEFVPNALGSGGDGGLIYYVKSKRAGIWPHALRGRLTMLDVSRPDDHGEAARREILRYLKTDSFISPCDQGDGFVVQRKIFLGPEYEVLFIFTIRIMRAQARAPLEPRKTPIQARSAATVDSISEATIQVLLSVGPDQLTTTRVAERAGVSIGTLYQYFPNKHSLLFSVLQQHLNHVADAVEWACRQNHGEPVSTMVDSVVHAFVDAKLERADISMALYALATGREETALVRKVEKRAQVALASMLATASDAQFDDLTFTSFLVFSAMGGIMRAILENGKPPRIVRLLRKQLILLCRGFLMNAARQA